MATSPSEPTATDKGRRAHASVWTYVTIAVVLTVVTALEFAVLYIRALTPILVPLLLVMSAGKFVLVVLFFMHLRYDKPLLTTLFAAPLLIAVIIVVAMMTLSDAFLIFER
ncbi:MAG: cytochrome C oxidase subunit IV family protein [Candidatus Rokuibacteriota bacterium]